MVSANGSARLAFVAVCFCSCVQLMALESLWRLKKGGTNHGIGGKQNVLVVLS